MKRRETEIARKYMLPERPFLHGMASAFDMFGVLNQDGLENMRTCIKAKTRQSEAESLRLVWQEVGDTLLLAIDQYERESVEGDSA